MRNKLKNGNIYLKIFMLPLQLRNKGTLTIILVELTQPYFLLLRFFSNYAKNHVYIVAISKFLEIEAVLTLGIA
jgi:hypothetical protein